MTQKIDFIPAEYEQARKRRDRLFRGVALGFTISGIVFILATSIRLQVVQANTKVEPLREQVASMRQWQERVGMLSEDLRGSIEHQAALDRLTQGANWVDFLDAMSDASNDRVWITDCRLTREEEKLEDGVSRSTSRLALSGVATSDVEVIELMAALSASPYVEDIRLETSRTSSARETLGMIEFAMAGTLRSSKGMK